MEAVEEHVGSLLIGGLIEEIFYGTFADSVDAPNFAGLEFARFNELKNRERVEVKDLCCVFDGDDRIMHAGYFI